MIKRLHKILKKIYKVILYSQFQNKILKTKDSEIDGEVVLFEKKFYYHHGLAFYNTYRELFLKNIYEFKTSKINPIIIDCGANMGLSVLFFSKKYPNAEIIAFEPDDMVLPFLNKNLISHNIKNVELITKAVWTSETNLKFHTDCGLGGRLEKEYDKRKSIEVKTVRLKDFLIRPIDFLKLDIEGAEYEVLIDCEDMLYNVDKIFIEYHSIYNEEQRLEGILALLKRQGFRYHLKESFSRKKPFVETFLVNEIFDMAINIFAYK